VPKNNKKTMNADQNEQPEQAVAPADDAVQPKAPVRRPAVSERRVYEILDTVRERPSTTKWRPRLPREWRKWRRR
jgi:hypothetical protein